MIAVACFWSALALVGYAYAGFPALVALLAARRGRVPVPGSAASPTLSVVIAAHDEAPRIAARVADLLAQDYPADRLQVIVVDDGSRDGTADAAAAIADARVEVVRLAENGGKALAVNAGVARARGEIVAFTDARQRHAPGALRALVAPFADARIGAVGGELAIASADAGGGAADAEGVGLYWRMERRLRSDEARLGWLHGVSGANFAVRRALFVPMPAGTILDDMWTPLQVVKRGHRVWYAGAAVVHDRHSASAGEEFRRKLRTLAGNWQLLARLPWLALPGRNPVWFAWVSHKLLRLLAPWALLVALLASALADGALYRVALLVQLLAYAAAALALWRPRLVARVPLLPAAGAFLMLNAAALLSLPTSLAMSPARLWKKH